MSIETTWLTALAGVLGGGGLTAIGSYLLARRREAAADHLADKNLTATSEREDRRQAVDHYDHFLRRLEERIERSDREHKEEMGVIIGKLEDCQKHHVACEREQAFIKGQMHELSKLVMRKTDGPMVMVEGAGDLRTIDVKSATSEVATFSPEGESNG